jgi:hypothetical protein
MNGTSSESAPHGLIHDWIGAVFIPSVSLSEVFAVVEDYDRYSSYFGPTVRTSKLLSRNNDVRSFRVQYVRKALFVTVAMNAEYRVQQFRVNDQHSYSIARSTSIRQIQNYGETREHELPPDVGTGFLWRAGSFVQFMANDGGVYIEQEDIALSRNIPSVGRWLIEPFVEHLSQELIAGWLGQTRDAVNRSRPKPVL